MLTVSADFSVLQGVAQFISYAVLAIFAENVVFARAMGVFPLIRTVLPAWLPATALRPLVYLSCAAVGMAVVWLLLGLTPAVWRVPCREQLPIATCTCSVLGTMLLCANQNYDLLQSIAFGFGSGVGYLFAVLVVDEGRRRLGSKDVPAIFRGLPSWLIYIGILSLALYALME